MRESGAACVTVLGVPSTLFPTITGTTSHANNLVSGPSLSHRSYELHVNEVHVLDWCAACRGDGAMVGRMSLYDGSVGLLRVLSRPCALVPHALFAGTVV